MQVFWCVTPCHWIGGSLSPSFGHSFWNFILRKMTALRSPEASEITNSASHNRGPKRQVHIYEIHKCHKLQEAGENCVFLRNFVICVGLLNNKDINRLKKTKENEM